MQPNPTRSRLLLVLTAVALSIACDKNGGAPNEATPPIGLRPAYLKVGTEKRLNLPPQAEAQIRFRDPMQGVKKADGECSFAHVGTPRKGLRFTVGKYDTVTCAGVLYWFDIPPYPKPITVDTQRVATTNAQADGWILCANLANGLANQDTMSIKMTIWGQSSGISGYDTPLATATLYGRAGWQPYVAPYSNGCARMDSVILIRNVYNDFSLGTVKGVFYNPQQTITLAEYAKARSYSTFIGSCGATRNIGIWSSLESENTTFDMGIRSSGQRYWSWGEPGHGSGFDDCVWPLNLPRLLFGEFVEGFW